MEEHDAVAIETTGNCQPVAEVAGSWLDQFRLKVDHRGRHESMFFHEIRQFTELVSISC